LRAYLTGLVTHVTLASCNICHAFTRGWRKLTGWQARAGTRVSWGTDQAGRPMHACRRCCRHTACVLSKLQCSHGTVLPHARPLMCCFTLCPVIYTSGRGEPLQTQQRHKMHQATTKQHAIKLCRPRHMQGTGQVASPKLHPALARFKMNNSNCRNTRKIKTKNTHMHRQDWRTLAESKKCGVMVWVGVALGQLLFGKAGR